MNRKIFEIKTAYTYNPEHKGAPYTMNGKNWFNGGELVEILVKVAYGANAKKDPNTKWCDGSDMPEYNASVKSGKATLTTDNIGKTFDEILANYFARVPSTMWIYGCVIDDKLVTYEMNRDEFEQFTRTFASLNERTQIRYKATSSKMIRWFDERVA